MSRVFSASWVLRPRLGCGGGRGPGLIVAVSKEDPGLASFLAVILLRRTRKKALSRYRDPQSTAKCQLEWGLAPLPAKALLRLPVSAFLALFL